MIKIDVLAHHGVKGMRWGVRRINKLSKKNEKLQRKDTKLYKKFEEYDEAIYKKVWNRGGYFKSGEFFKSRKKYAKAIKNGKKIIDNSLTIKKIMDKNFDMMKKAGSTPEDLKEYKREMDKAKRNIEKILASSHSVYDSYLANYAKQNPFNLNYKTYNKYHSVR